VVEEAWHAGGNNLQEVYNALGSVRQRLKTWSIAEFGSVKKQLKKLRERREVVRSNSLRSGPSREEKSLLSKISELLSREEVLERQRSRALWLAEGDGNTSFFHARTKERARRNKIKSLRREDGSVVTSQEGLENEAIGFYKNLFTAQADTNPGLVTDWVERKVDDVMNDQLCA
jgi:hypothetical protein